MAGSTPPLENFVKSTYIYEAADKAKHALELIQDFPLATVIRVQGGDAQVAHLPLISEIRGEQIVMLGHFANKQPIWREIDGEMLTLIFHGPESYITPKWYVENDVPTWFYASVHIRGCIQVFREHRQVLKNLAALSKAVEAGTKDPWAFYLPDDLSRPEDLLGYISAFEIQVETMDLHMKLGLHRSALDQQRVKMGLRETGRGALADWIERFERR